MKEFIIYEGKNVQVKSLCLKHHAMKMYSDTSLCK
jgi:hypothetical protein